VVKLRQEVRRIYRRGSLRMIDIAETAGCSTTTVSHVLNGTRRVAAGTRQRVERAIAELGDRHHIGRAGNDIPTVAFTLPALSSPYFSDLVKAVEQELGRAGLGLVLAETNDDQETERRAVECLLQHRIDALVMVPTAGWRRTTLPLLRERSTPFVIVDRIVEADVDQVAVENAPGACMLVEHLLTLGHRRIGMITGLPGLSTTLERELGYRQAHQRRLVELDVTLMVCGESSLDGGRRAVRRLLNRPAPPTALFIGNNAMTVGVLSGLESRNVLAPRDIAVVAFDDFEFSALVRPQLTAAAQPNNAVGVKAVELLLHRMANPDLPAHTVRFPVSIAHRDSCGCEGTSLTDLAECDLGTLAVG